MPLQLTTPVSVGALDAHDYSHVRISSFSLDVLHRAIQFQTTEGYLEGGEFVRGQHSRDRNWEVRDLPARGVVGEDGYVAADPMFTDMVGGTYGDESELLYDGVANTLYQWLIDQGHYVGSIV